MIALVVAVLVVAAAVTAALMIAPTWTWVLHHRIPRQRESWNQAVARDGTFFKPHYVYRWTQTINGVPCQFVSSHPVIDVTFFGQPFGEPFHRWERVS